MIGAFGGASLFYKQFYFSAMSPLGFIKHGKNLNYYDDKNLLQLIQPFIIDCMQQQLAFGLKTDAVLLHWRGRELKIFTKAERRTCMVQ
jgi:hypothetical protein